MKYKKIYESKKPGMRPVSIWIDTDPMRMFDNVIIGQNIKENNIKYKRFDYSVEFCQSEKELRYALKQFGIYDNVIKSKSVSQKLADSVTFFWKK